MQILGLDLDDQDQKASTDPLRVVRTSRLIMRILTRQFASIAIKAAAGLALVSCDVSKHEVVETPAGKKTICRLCYDEITKAPPHPRYGPMGGARRVHKCVECDSDVTIYAENGVTRVRCAKCAPEGMECDQCQPAD